MKNNVTVIPNPTHCIKCPIKDRSLYQVFSNDYIQDAEHKRTEQISIPARTSLYDEHDISSKVYTLFEGWLLLYRSHTDGGRQGLRIALSGDFIGYSPLLGSPRNHAALALTPSVLCGFKQEDLHGMMNDHSALAMQVTQHQAKDLALCQTHILGIGIKSAEGRIVHLILELYDRLKNRGLVSIESKTMPFPLTQEVISHMTGLSQVHVNRVMSKLKSDKLMTCKSKQLTLLNWGKLTEIGEYISSPLNH